MDLTAALAKAALPRKTVELCLQGDLVAELEDLERQLRDSATTVATMADTGARRVLAEGIEAMRARMQDAMVVFTLQGLPRTPYTDLLRAHPPAKDSPEDRDAGFHPGSFFPALVHACLVDPQVSDEQWAQLDSLLSAGQFDELANAALAVCRRKVDVPFSFAASATLRSSDETST